MGWRFNQRILGSGMEILLPRAHTIPIPGLPGLVSPCLGDLQDLSMAYLEVNDQGTQTLLRATGHGKRAYRQIDTNRRFADIESEGMVFRRWLEAQISVLD